MDEADVEVRTPMKRLGSSRKLVMFNNIRGQLAAQLKCLETRTEAQTALAAELQDYFRRRADLEADYSRGLDKLARSVRQRHREQKHKREEWSLMSGAACWEQLVDATAALGRDHAALAQLYGARVVPRLASAADDAARLHRKCRDIAADGHDDILRALGELHAAMKTHAERAAEWRAAAAKLRAASSARHAAVAAAAAGKKLKPLEKELEKRRTKHAEAKLRALRARGEYLLCLDAANTTLHKYFVDDLSDLIDVMDLGYHSCLSRALRTHASADEGRARALHHHAQLMHGCVEALDSQLDKQRFLEAHQQAFMIPRKLSYAGGSPQLEEADAECEEEREEGEGQRDTLAREMEERLAQLEGRLRALRTESDEASKTLDEAERTLALMVDVDDWDASELFGAPEPPADGAESPLETPPAAAGAPMSPHTPERRHEMEDFYLAKFREYLAGGGRIARLESRAAALRSRLGRGGAVECGAGRRARRRGAAGARAGSAAAGVFAAPLEAHLAATGRELPVVLTSCCRVIQLYGLRHQGIFRVSGSHADIGSLRAGFERGRDPLASVADASDINSVAGLLKLYLRELRPPLIPPVYRDHLLQLAQLETGAEFVKRMREFVVGLPRASMLTLRYLFAFLNHLAEYSEDNMMDEWNLAICFGPTLLPVTDERDQVLCQNLLNELVKNLIVHHADVFPQDAPPFYRRYAPPAPPHRDVSTHASARDAHEEARAPEEGEPEGGAGELSARPAMRRCAVDCAESAGAGPASQPSAGADACGAGVGGVSVLQEGSVPVDESSGEAAEAPSEGHHVSTCPSKQTPDLVLDLPAGSEPAQPTSPAAPSPSAADTFLNNRDTLKRRPSPPTHGQPDRECEEAAVGAGAAPCEGSPVPARNTQRVAAKFAELTLTGGSAKPAVAVKPSSLLRRLTPPAPST